MSKYFQITYRLWKILAKFHNEFYFQIIYIIISQIGVVSTIWVSSKLLDEVVKGQFSLAYKFAFIFIAIKIADLLLAYIFDRRSFLSIDNKIPQYLQEFTLKKIFNLNPFQYQQDHSAIKLQVVDRGENSVANIISTVAFDILPTFTQVTFSLIMIFVYSKIIFSIIFITLLIAIVWTKFFSDFHRPLIKKNIDNWDNIRKIRSESYQHLYLVKMLSIAEKFIGKYLNDRSKVLEFDKQVWLYSFNHGIKRRGMFLISRNLITIVLIYLTSVGAATVGSLYALWQYTNTSFDNIFNLLRAIRQLPIRFSEVEKYLDIIDLQPEFNEHGKLKLPSKDKLKIGEELNTEIVFKDLTFKYPKGDSNVLENINLTIPHGKRVAFVGHSGSGKTTIVKLLMRAYDYVEGVSITIGGLELRDINSHSLRSAIGYVEQHVDLFDTTVRDNILMSVDEETLTKWEKLDKKSKKNQIGFIDQKLEEVARLARIDEFYHRLGEKKFDTEIGERGIKLSGGERQRVGIARAIIKDPSILILDEATSALDTINEKYIKEAIDNVSVGRTTIIIAHRLSTVEDANMIVVMDKGQVVATGTHAELLLFSTHYQELIEAQLK